MEMKRILVIEDDELLRQLYIDVLNKEGYFVDFAEDGAKGLLKMQEGNWDLVLLDIILPEINGLDIAKKIKANPPEKPIKAIFFLSNLYEDAQSKEALTLGNKYFAKSAITPGDLLREVKAQFSQEDSTNLH